MSYQFSGPGGTFVNKLINNGYVLLQCGATLIGIGIGSIFMPGLFPQFTGGAPPAAPPPPPPPPAPAPPSGPSTLEDLSPIQNFGDFMTMFNKVYEPQDIATRQRIFTENMQLINVSVCCHFLLMFYYIKNNHIFISILESQRQFSGGTGIVLHQCECLH